MNAERLRELVEFLIQENDQLAVQQKLDQLVSELNNLTANPGDPGSQTAVSSSVSRLRQAIAVDFASKVSPAVADSIDEIGGTPYFSQNMVEGIQSTLTANAITPAAVRDSVQELSRRRAEYVSSLRQTAINLKALQVGLTKLRPGDAELGFLVPRELFQNDFKGLVKELGEIDRIINAFSEATTGSIEPISLGQISSTNPLIFVGTDVRVVLALAASVTWILNTWKQALEIKKVYDQGQGSGLPKKILDEIKAHINSQVDKEIKERAKELLKGRPKDLKLEEGRSNELENYLVWALRALLAKIERGLTLEVRFLPPATAEGEVTDEDANLNAKFEELKAIAMKLEFPRVSGEPLIPLPRMNTDNKGSG